MFGFGEAVYEKEMEEHFNREFDEEARLHAEMAYREAVMNGSIDKKEAKLKWLMEQAWMEDEVEERRHKEAEEAYNEIWTEASEEAWKRQMRKKDCEGI